MTEQIEQEASFNCDSVVSLVCLMLWPVIPVVRARRNGRSCSLSSSISAYTLGVHVLVVGPASVPDHGTAYTTARSVQCLELVYNGCPSRATDFLSVLKLFKSWKICLK